MTNNDLDFSCMKLRQKKTMKWKNQGENIKRQVEKVADLISNDITFRKLTIILSIVVVSTLFLLALYVLCNMARRIKAKSINK